MIALVHERGFAKPAYDARVVALGRELDARRNSGWLWLSTQEQVALARLGKALMADQAKRVSGQWTVGDVAVRRRPPRASSAACSTTTRWPAGVQLRSRRASRRCMRAWKSPACRATRRQPDSSHDQGRRASSTRTDGKRMERRPLKEGDSLIVQSA